MIRFPREKIVTEWHEMDVETFVNKYLREVRCFEGKYHFYVASAIQSGMLSWAFQREWKETNFDLCEFDVYYSTDPLQKEIRDDIIMFLKSFEVEQK